jgi:hypothetical protein
MAADVAPELTDLWQTLQDNRHRGARMVAAHLESYGPLRTGLDTERATDTLWLFNDPAQYTALVHQRGWPPDAFRDWLAQMMRIALLPAHGPSNPPRATPRRSLSRATLTAERNDCRAAHHGDTRCDPDEGYSLRHSSAPARAIGRSPGDRPAG